MEIYDSITASDIPPDVPGVAGYVDGAWAWSLEDWARFGTWRKLRIATRASTLDADMLDVERYDAIPAEAPAWVRRARTWLPRPLVYCSRDTRPLVVTACRGLDYDLCIATLDGVPFLQPGTVMTQWRPALPGQHWDVSITAEDWPPAPVALVAVLEH